MDQPWPTEKIKQLPTEGDLGCWQPFAFMVDVVVNFLVRVSSYVLMHLWREKMNSYWVAGCVYRPLHSGGRLPSQGSLHFLQPLSDFPAASLMYSKYFLTFL